MAIRPSDQQTYMQPPVPPKQKKSVRQFLRRPYWYATGFVVVCLIIVGSIVLFTRTAAPYLPKDVTNRVPYPVYFPKPMPTNVSYQKNSASVQSDILSYRLDYSKTAIYISEQSAPTRPPSLKSIIGFKPFDIPYGTAVIGSNGSGPTVVILTNTTLILINTKKNVPQDVLVTISKQLSTF